MFSLPPGLDVAAIVSEYGLVMSAFLTVSVVVGAYLIARSTLRN